MKVRPQADVIDLQLWRAARASQPPMPQQSAASATNGAALRVDGGVVRACF